MTETLSKLAWKTWPFFSLWIQFGFSIVSLTFEVSVLLSFWKSYSISFCPHYKRTNNKNETLGLYLFLVLVHSLIPFCLCIFIFLASHLEKGKFNVQRQVVSFLVLFLFSIISWIWNFLKKKNFFFSLCNSLPR